ncbi:hypothetical protein [Amycolatopsis sp. CA-230715]|uniref:hypothetical protein n=1 Tax=Amycolatopsis sp. CA-230715 TaxID=2745196 RepID=UPI001C034826|nr:hypothetical protein [Amycolatopsis sp. CA-230715]
MSITVLAGAIRLLVLVADYLLAFVTATVVIPELAVWLHRTSGAGSGKLTIDGTVAMWAVPLVFLVAILTVGEIAVMRALWQWASRAIRTIRDRRSAAEPTLARTGRRRATRKQKKRT